MNLVKIIITLTPLIALLFSGGILVYYRLHRKFKREYKGKFAWIGDNMIEILIVLMFIAIAAPDWGKYIFGGGN